MEILDESIVWDQYATYVATDGSFLTPQPDPALFRSFLAESHDGTSKALGGDSQGCACRV